MILCGPWLTVERHDTLQSLRSVADGRSSMTFRGLSQTHHGCAGEAVGAAVTERDSPVDDEVDGCLTGGQ